MSDDTIKAWTTFGDWGLWASLGFVALFVVMYAFVSGWWRHEMGRHVMIFMAVALLNLSIRSMRLVLGEHDWWYPIRGVSLWLLAAVLGWRVLLLVRRQLFNRRRVGEAADHEGGGHVGQDRT